MSEKFNYHGHDDDEEDKFEKVRIYSYGSMPMSLFHLGFLFLGLCLVICIPFLILSYSESIGGFIKLLKLFIIWSIVTWVMGLIFES